MSKATLNDLAAHTGLSTATIDRVLHGRAGVSRRAQEKVAQAIHALRFGELPADLIERSLPQVRLHFILPELETSFVVQMLRAVADAPRAVVDARVTIDTTRLDLRENRAVVRALDATDPAIYAGIALFAVNGPGVRQAIDRAVARGLKVVSLVTDIRASRRHHFVGIDNVAAGRTAGSLMGRFLSQRSGTIGVIAGSMQMRDQVDRHRGFEQAIRARFPDLRILVTEQGESLRDTNHAITRKLLADHPDLLGLYSVGAGTTGILDALRETGAGSRIAVIVHELSDAIRAGLADGTIDVAISQNTGHIARAAARILTSLHLVRPINHEQEKIGIDLYLADNLP